MRAGTPPAFAKPARRTGVDDFKDYLTMLYADHGASAERLLAEIQPQGFGGSVNMGRRFLRGLKPLRAPALIATLRFETPPGVQAHCDRA